MINMSKNIRRVGSRRNEHRVLKGVIHIEASFGNTIVIVTDVWGQMLSRFFLDACGFKSIRRGTPFVL